MTDPAGLKLGWSRKWSLTARILAVNLVALTMMGAGIFFLDSYRNRLITERANAALVETRLLRDILPRLTPGEQQDYLAELQKLYHLRVRKYARDGQKLYDSDVRSPGLIKITPAADEPVFKKMAGLFDRLFDAIVPGSKLEPYVEQGVDSSNQWPEIATALRVGQASHVRIAEDYTHVINAVASAPDQSYTVMTTANPRDIRSLVRAQRARVALFILAAMAISIALSLFLARTIALPLQHLSRAAVKVRMGRSPEVHVPRLPERRDEIGMLARALSDMSIALRMRIDATEAFAADVAHEIKNPLASLRSALDGLTNVDDPALRRRLMAVAQADVHRMDRLISDISDASRIDAQLAKARFEPIDLGEMIDQLLAARDSRGANSGIRVAFARPRRGVAVVAGEDFRLERVLTNLIDNAVSFSPPDGLVEVSATQSDGEVIIRIDDQGPGVPAEDRENIFRRFHSVRPDGEAYGKHSGLGLAIARTIIEGHHGSIAVSERGDGLSGASFHIALPAHSRQA